MNRNLIIIFLIALAVITRLLPHPPNVAPITGIALFAVHRFQNKKLAFLLPIFCMLLTDIFLGFHSDHTFCILIYNWYLLHWIIFRKNQKWYNLEKFHTLLLYIKFWSMAFGVP